MNYLGFFPLSKNYSFEKQTGKETEREEEEKGKGGRERMNMNEPYLPYAGSLPKCIQGLSQSEASIQVSHTVTRTHLFEQEPGPEPKHSNR